MNLPHHLLVLVIVVLDVPCLSSELSEPVERAGEEDCRKR